MATPLLRRLSHARASALLISLCVLPSGLQALELSKELGRLPADKRPTAEQIKAAEDEIAAQKAYLEALKVRLAPELKEWAIKGKPYLPRAIYPTDLPQSPVPAFPGAEGAGKYSFGGRGGRVFVVNTLEDGGPGSFREACEAAGPRTVVFNVSGIIHLKQPLTIVAPYLTIAGQSAPGDGVCIAGRSVLVDTHDVVIRYMRFRRGATNIFDRDDCLGGQPIGNIIIDHVSTSWGLDENLSMYRHVYKLEGSKEFIKYPTLNFTIQWSISTEALNTYGHAFGGTWGGFNTSFHHNLFSSNTARNASIGMSYDFNFVNNVLFNWRHRSLDGGDQGSRVNCINNYYKPGPVTENTAVRHRIGIPQSSTFKPDPTERRGKWYVSGNVVEGDDTVTADNWKGGVQFKDSDDAETHSAVDSGERVESLVKSVRVDQAFTMAPITVEPARQAFDSVLERAGATLPVRDSVDQRAVRQTRTGEVDYKAGSGIITDVAQVGGYPDYRGAPRADLCPDGIPLSWKTKYKLDPKDAELASRDLLGDGYTVLEKYLDGLDPAQRIDWSDAKSNLNTLSLAKLRE